LQSIAKPAEQPFIVRRAGLKRVKQYDPTPEARARLEEYRASYWRQRLPWNIDQQDFPAFTLFDEFQCLDAMVEERRKPAPRPRKLPPDLAKTVQTARERIAEIAAGNLPQTREEKVAAMAPKPLPPGEYITLSGRRVTQIRRMVRDCNTPTDAEVANVHRDLHAARVLLTMDQVHILISSIALRPFEERHRIS
jgi:hypothetical protein